jgi:hypothetical protein
LNQGPIGYEPTALTTELHPLLDLAARQNLGLAAPGEKVLIVPSAVAMKFVDRSVIASTKPQTTTPDHAV